MASKFISKTEGYVQVNSLEPLVDRYKLLTELYEWELKYQYHKYRKVELLMDMYEHTTDPLNNYKLILQIFEVMKVVPRIDYEETYFRSSYQKEIEILENEIRILERVKDLIQK